jgi:hypothetical protein
MRKEEVAPIMTVTVQRTTDASSAHFRQCFNEPKGCRLDVTISSGDLVVVMTDVRITGYTLSGASGRTVINTETLVFGGGTIVIK